MGVNNHSGYSIDIPLHDYSKLIKLIKSYDKYVND